jgi:hypothetical protein
MTVARIYGAVQESNLPSRGLHGRTGLDDRLGQSLGPGLVAIPLLVIFMPRPKD